MYCSQMCTSYQPWLLRSTLDLTLPKQNTVQIMITTLIEILGIVVQQILSG